MPPSVASESDMISMRQPRRSQKRVYMRKRSAANSAASSPPVPARISTMALRSSSGSRGRSSGVSRRLELGDRRARDALDFGARFGGHLGVVNRNELAHLRELVFVFLQLGRQLDDRIEPAVLPAELRELSRIAEPGSGWRALARLLRRGRARPLTGRGAPGDASARCCPACFANFWRKRSTRPAVSMQALLAREERVAGRADVGVDLARWWSESGTYSRRRT